jgi:hypothetical protein
MDFLLSLLISLKSQNIVLENNIEFSFQEETQDVCSYSDGNLPKRNNNPLNVTYGKYTKKFVDEGRAEISITKDGRKFLKFCKEEYGWEAGKHLLKTAYADMDPEYAMKRWSNGGYGKIFDKKISEMTDDEVDSFMKEIATREGFYSES